MSGGEDEVSCPYTTQSCGEGFIDAGNKCYRFENQTRRITWKQASTMCQSYGQQLVTLKTPQEWRDFQRILDYGKRSAHVYVGLLSPDTSDLELMYGDVLQWIDGTMAHYVQQGSGTHVQVRQLADDSLLSRLRLQKRRKAAEVRLLERLQSRVHSEGYSLHNIKQVKATDNREGRDAVIKQIKDMDTGEGFDL
ncbi:hypothetical protein C0Q70_11776 [Pomacea canaliculata]|uniref:C-type lectin domain-containing protein n=1 Tax=Pomacea canaliculata TaxID=400727 RepID=A0A2T7P6Z7_POMCA|nr:hypothetical protein C0Q70_11776 [Pomacea canaliculata]